MNLNEPCVYLARSSSRCRTTDTPWIVVIWPVLPLDFPWSLVTVRYPFNHIPLHRIAPCTAFLFQPPSISRPTRITAFSPPASSSIPPSYPPFHNLPAPSTPRQNGFRQFHAPDNVDRPARAPRSLRAQCTLHGRPGLLPSLRSAAGSDGWLQLCGRGFRCKKLSQG